jgi:hypothetical protein
LLCCQSIVPASFSLVGAPARILIIARSSEHEHRSHIIITPFGLGPQEKQASHTNRTTGKMANKKNRKRNNRNRQGSAAAQQQEGGGNKPAGE